MEGKKKKKKKKKYTAMRQFGKKKLDVVRRPIMPHFMRTAISQSANCLVPGEKKGQVYPLNERQWPEKTGGKKKGGKKSNLSVFFCLSGGGGCQRRRKKEKGLRKKTRKEEKEKSRLRKSDRGETR